MKSMFIAAAASLALLTSAANAAPFQTNPVVQQATFQTTTYTIAAGKTFKSLQIPVQNRPLQMMVASTTTADSGVGSVTLLRAVGSEGNFLEWSGTDMAEGATGAFANTPGAHIMYADSGKQIDIQLNSVDTIRIVNLLPVTATVVVTLIY